MLALRLALCAHAASVVSCARVNHVARSQQDAQGLTQVDENTLASPEELKLQVEAARTELLDTVVAGGDALIASGTFSLKIIKVAREVYTQLVSKGSYPDHAVVLAGSGGRYEMATYSDLEYLVSFDGNCPSGKNASSFERRLLRAYRKKLATVGLESDAINQPAFIKKTIACTPGELAGTLLMKGDQVSTSMVLETSWMGGNESIAEKVRGAIDSWLSKTAVAAAAEGKPKISIKKTLKASDGTLRDFVVGELKTWKYSSKMESAAIKAEAGLEKLSFFNIKELLYRPLQDIVSVSAWAAHALGGNQTVGAFNVQSRLEFLASDASERIGRRWSAELVGQMRAAMEVATRVRVLSHAAAQGENNDVCFSCESEDVYKIPEELHAPLQRAGGVVACLVRATDEGASFPPDSC